MLDRNGDIKVITDETLEDLPALAVESVKKTIFDENRIPCKSSQKSIPQAPKLWAKFWKCNVAEKPFSNFL
jgi:hypothetical protein